MFRLASSPSPRHLPRAPPAAETGEPAARARGLPRHSALCWPPRRKVTLAVTSSTAVAPFAGARRARGERAEAAPRAARAGKSNIYIEHNRKIRNRLNYIKSLAGRRYYLYPSAPQGPRLGAGAGAWHGASGQGARPTRGSGEAARNNVVMSAGERTSCPGLICYLLSICRCYLRETHSAFRSCADEPLEGGRCCLPQRLPHKRRVAEMRAIGRRM